jgi:hypothetical protein
VAEIALTIAHQVYIVGLSFDKVCLLGGASGENPTTKC